MTDENTLWEQVRKVDLGATKDDTTGGYSSTSINGYWFFRRASELWGPCGQKWGYRITRNEYREGVQLSREDGTVIGVSQMHTIEVEVWYPGSKEPVIGIGHTPFVYMTKRGPYADFEVEKKSLTDAIKKALSMLGFASEIFEGEFDDREYLSARRLEQSIQDSSDKEQHEADAKAELTEMMSNSAETLGKAQSANEIKGIMSSVQRHLAAQGKIPILTDLANKGLVRLKELAAKRKTDLEAMKNGS